MNVGASALGRRSARALAAAGVLVLAAGEARANGRFPAANQLVIDPADPNHLVVGVTFGLLESRDGGASFSWACERVLNVADGEDPIIVVSDAGTTVLGTFAGVVVSQDGCTYERVPELADEIVPDLVTSPTVPGRIWGYRTEGLPEGRFDSELIRSDDGGLTWERVAALPDTLLPLTIDVAGSPERLYLTARLGRTADYESVLLRSDDEGATFETFPIPGTVGQRLAFIGAVDPTDPDRVYVRIDDAGTVVVASSDGGETFETLFTGTGRLLGLALSPDGETLALGGPSDGVWVGDARGADFERRSDLAPTCLRFGEDALFACTDWADEGFSVAKSMDNGHRFEPLLDFESLCGPTACPAGTPAGDQCGADWNLVAPQLGATCGVTATGGTGGQPNGAAGSSPSEPARRSDGGCAIASLPGASGHVVAGLLVLAGAIIRWARAGGTARRRRAARP